MLEDKDIVGPQVGETLVLSIRTMPPAEREKSTKFSCFRSTSSTPYSDAPSRGAQREFLALVLDDDASSFLKGVLLVGPNRVNAP
jgi:hypothetical protein